MCKPESDASSNRDLAKLQTKAFKYLKIERPADIPVGFDINKAYRASFMPRNSKSPKATKIKLFAKTKTIDKQIGTSAKLLKYEPSPINITK
jgi:hypothetical protein